MEEIDHHSTGMGKALVLSRGTRKQAIIAQLAQFLDRTYNVDDIVHWLIKNMVRQYRIEIMQLWYLQTLPGGQTRVELKTTYSKNPHLPPEVICNQQIVEVVKQCLSRQRGEMPQRVTNTFLPQQAHVLAGYGLHYWGCYYLRGGNELIAPVSSNGTPLRMAVTFFTAQEPEPRLTPNIGMIMERTLQIINTQKTATNRPDIPKEEPSTPKIGHYSAADLVPQRIQMIDPQESLPDRQVRRLYLTIDGRRNLGKLASITHIRGRALINALQQLLDAGHIRLCQPGGQVIQDMESLLPVHST